MGLGHFVFVIDSGIDCRVFWSLIRSARSFCPWWWSGDASFDFFCTVATFLAFTSVHTPESLLPYYYCALWLSVYLGSPVSAIFQFRTHRWGCYLRKKCEQHVFYSTRTYPLINDNDDDAIFIGIIAAWWRVCVGGGGVLLSLCCFALSDEWRLIADAALWAVLRLVAMSIGE